MAGAAVFAFGILLNFDQIVGTFEILLTRGNPRFDVWLSGIRFYGWELLTGVGKVDNQFTVDNPYDSTYFRILLQVGIGGLALFLLVNLKAGLGLVRRLLSKRDPLGASILIFLVALHGGFAFRVDLLVFPVSLYYWFGLALAIRVVAESV